jgi:AcrR family transcriptional regulator
MTEIERTEDAANVPLEPTKARLLEAAGEEFSARGYDGATIRSIAQRAGANIAAVNYHFGDKESLYVQVVLHAHRSAIQFEPHALHGQPPSDQLRTWITQMLRHILGMEARPTWHHDVMMREMLRPTRASEALVREVIRPRFQRLRAIIAAIRPGLDARALDAYCFSVVGQCLFYKMTRDMASLLIGREALQALDLNYLSAHISGVMLSALGPRSVPAPVAEHGADGNVIEARS